MAGTITPWFRQQWLDADGDPLSSGTLETYETGTSTPLATYSDAALSVSNGTTVTLNAGGFPTVTGAEVGLFLLPRAYRFVLKNSAGTTQRTIDGVFAVQAASSVNLEIDGIAGEALAAGEWAYLSNGSGSLTAGRWYRTDSDLAYASVYPQIAFVSAAIASGATGTLRLGGVADNLSGLSAGSTYYLSGTAGALTTTAPASARSVGVATSATAIAISISPVQMTSPRTTISTAFETAGRFTSTVTGGASTTFDTVGLSLLTSATGTSSAKITWVVARALNNGGVFTTYPGEFGVSFSLAAFGTDFQAFVGLGTITVTGTLITYTVNHIGFKIVRAASGAASLYATQADGTETASAALTTLVNDDRLDLACRVDNAASVTYWWRKNGSAWSAPTVLTTNVPTAATDSLATVAVSNATVASATTIYLTGASYSR